MVSVYWLKLQAADLSAYTRLVFDVRADPQPGIPGQVKLELKRRWGSQHQVRFRHWPRLEDHERQAG